MNQLLLADRRILKDNDFLSPADIEKITPQILVERIKAIQPIILENSANAEILRRPVDLVWNAIRATGYFYLFVPKKFGGLEFGVDTFIDATLAIAECCPSTAWVASFCCEHNFLTAQYPEETQKAIWAERPYTNSPSIAFPPGRAVPTEGGYILNGHWKWGTCIMHSDWVMVQALRQEGENMVGGMYLVRAEDVIVPDNWNFIGLAGTGSNDVIIKDLFVPETHVFNISPVRSGRGLGSKIHENPIYSAPMLPQLCVVAALPALGAAKFIVSEIKKRMEVHVKHGGLGQQNEKPAGQIRLARADLMIKAAETMIRKCANENIEIGAIDEPEQTPLRIQLRAQIALAVEQCLEAARIACGGAGSGIYDKANPIQRALRDLMVAQSHVVFDMDVATELHGRALLGLPPNSVLI